MIHTSHNGLIESKDTTVLRCMKCISIFSSRSSCRKDIRLIIGDRSGR